MTPEPTLRLSIRAAEKVLSRHGTHGGARNGPLLRTRRRGGACGVLWRRARPAKGRPRRSYVPCRPGLAASLRQGALGASVEPSATRRDWIDSHLVAAADNCEAW